MIREIDTNSEVFFKKTDEFKITKEDTELAEEVVEDLTDTLKANPDRYYICANEIGRTERAAVVKFGDEYLEFLNVIFQEKLKPEMIREIDPSDGKEYIMPRFTDTTICYQTKTGEVKANKLNKEASVVFCQVVNCLNGLHDADYGLEIIPEFDQATDEERAEVINAYIESINQMRDELDEELSKNEEVKDWWNKFKFDAAVASGKVEFEKPETPPMNRKQRRLLNRIAKKLGGKKND